MKLFLLTISSFLIFQSSGNANAPIIAGPVSTVETLNLPQYLGLWYQIAAIPQAYEKQCVANVRAEYAMAEDGLTSILNSCETRNGERDSVMGRAKLADGTSNAKLKVTFVNFLGWRFNFSGDYWVLGLGNNYSYAIVGGPKRNAAWILCRTSTLSQDNWMEINLKLAQQGYDPCLLITTIQAGGVQENKPFCQMDSN
jgi:apolipoprotein D and lipocalin family protein